MKNRWLSWINLFLVTSFISKIGNKIYMIAVPILVYQITGSPVYMGSMFFVQTIPILLSSYFGAFADTFSKKRLMLIANLIQFSVALLIGLLLKMNLLSIQLLFVFGFIISLSGAILGVSNESVIPEIVDRKELLKINSIYQFLDTFALLVGPSLGGLLLSLLSVQYVFYIDAITFIPLILAISTLKYTSVAIGNDKKESMHTKVKLGFKYVIGNRVLLTIMLLSCAINFAHGAIESMFVFFIKDELKLSNAYVGLIFSISAGAQLVFAMFSKYLVKKVSHKGILLNTQILSGVGVLIMVVFSPWYMVALGRSLQEGPVVSYNIVNRTLRQSIVPKEFLGRVNGINRMIAMASFPIAGFVSGLLVEIIGIKFVLYSSGLLLILIGILGYFTSISKLDHEYIETVNNGSTLMSKGAK